jgi:hypothetical protein
MQETLNKIKTYITFLTRLYLIKAFIFFAYFKLKKKDSLQDSIGTGYLFLPALSFKCEFIFGFIYSV